MFLVGLTPGRLSVDHGVNGDPPGGQGEPLYPSLGQDNLAKVVGNGQAAIQVGKSRNFRPEFEPRVTKGYRSLEFCDAGLVSVKPALHLKPDVLDPTFGHLLVDPGPCTADQPFWPNPVKPPEVDGPCGDFDVGSVHFPALTKR